MYSELDIHVETVCDRLMEYFMQHATDMGDPQPTIESWEKGVHPTSTIICTNSDGRRFAITIVTEELG